MRRFHFELEKILKLRENREKETEIELGKAIGILSVLELRIKNIALEKRRPRKIVFPETSMTY